jgi:hypothetical protein
MDAMIHDDEQDIAYKRHLERINISYLLEYNFPSRYSCNSTELLNTFNLILFTQEVASNKQ